MPDVVEIRRIRRRRDIKKRPFRSITWLIIVIMALAMVIVGMLGFNLAVTYAGMMQDLPDVTQIGVYFSDPGQEAFHPTRLYDRKGKTLLFEAIHPKARYRRWLRIEGKGSSAIPESVIQATVAYQDASSWMAQSPKWQSILWIVLERASQFYCQQFYCQHTHSQQYGGEGEDLLWIAEKLVDATLMPITDQKGFSAAQRLQTSILAFELTQRYSQQQILEWYLNSAYYGHMAYGIDAAALVYFGKHAADLSLAESAMLAHIPLQPDLNPIDAPSVARQQQGQVLVAMRDKGMITEAERKRALSDVMAIDRDVDGAIPSFVRFAWKELQEIFGPRFAARERLQIMTTIDSDLEMEADCAARTYLRRMEGGPADAVEPTWEGGHCDAADMLQPMRPSDIGKEHRITDIAWVMIEPETGEILSLGGPVDLARPAGSAFDPFIYLTAFTRGFSPGSMVLDMPTLEGQVTSSQSKAGAADYHGPVRMRIALVNGYQGARQRTVELVGADNVIQTAWTMGIQPRDLGGRTASELLQAEEMPVSLVDLTFAYSVIANEGRMAGKPSETRGREADGHTLAPTMILQVRNQDEVIYELESGERSILSRSLAYLAIDSLSDYSVRQSWFALHDTLAIGVPVGVLPGTTGEAKDNWTVGFTPSLSMGIWLGNLEGRPMQDIEASNGAASFWSAMMAYATRDSIPEKWTVPSDVSKVDVCDPSGLLPTDYCPLIVGEVFLQGTEPGYYDNLYQPFLINRETGKLATLFTPLELVEEEVYLIPPPEAAEWAHMAGIDYPPEEYDTLYSSLPSVSGVQIAYPEAFDYLRGEIEIRGEAICTKFDYRRLQYGEGLNPTHWIQIGDDRSRAVRNGILGKWDTEGLDGLYALKLMVVDKDDLIAVAAVPVIIDNLAPVVEFLLPENGQEFQWPQEREVRMQVDLEEVAPDRVKFYVDGRLVSTVFDPPYTADWPIGLKGEHYIYARAYDKAGNMAESARITITVKR